MGNGEDDNSSLSHPFLSSIVFSFVNIFQGFRSNIINHASYHNISTRRPSNNRCSKETCE